MYRFFLLCLLSLGLSACTAPLPENTVPLNRGKVQSAPAVSHSIDVNNAARFGTIQPGAQIQMIIAGEEELSGFYEVEEDGILFLPLIDEVEVSGLSLEEVREKITLLYQDGYLVAPQITIEIVR